MRKLILLLSLILPLSLAAQVEYDTVTVVDPEDFTLAVTIDTASLQFFSKKNDVWLRVNPQTLKDWIDLDSVSYYGDTLRIYQGGNPVPFKVEILAGLEDGDYGDVDVSGGGLVWNIDTAVVGANELASSGVTPGIYTLATITVDEDGRIISASNGSEVDGDVTNEIQQIDTLSLSGTILSLSLSLDGVAAETLDLAALQDGTGTDDQTLSWNGSTGELSIESGNTVDLDGRYLQTEVDGSVTNEGLLSVGAGGANTSTITSNTSGSNTVTISGGGIVTVTENTGTHTITVSATEVDGSVTNEAWTIDATGGDTEVISNQTVLFAGAGIASTSYSSGTNTLTITATEVDGSVSNEGSLTVGAGTATTSLINSNTAGSTPVTLEAGANITLSEAGSTITIAATGDGTGTDDQTLTWTGGTGELSIESGNTVDLDGRYLESFTEVDGSVTNEGALTVGAGGANTSTIVSNTSGSTPVTIAGGTNVTVTEAGSTITIAATDTQLTAEQVQDLVGAMFDLNTETLIDVQYSDLDGTIDLVVEPDLSNYNNDAGFLTSEVDGSVTNEGSLTVGAGTATSSTISSNTSGSTPVTIEVTGGLAISEVGNTITLDGSGISGSDNLGNHVATASLNMDGNEIDSVSVLQFDDTDGDLGQWAILEKGTVNVGDLWLQHSGDTGPTLALFQNGTVEINDAYTLPNVDGFSGYVLKTNGAGVVSWQVDETGGTGSADDAYGEAFLIDPDTLAINAGTPVKLTDATAGDLKDFSYSAGRLTYSGPTAMFLVNYTAEVEGENSGALAKSWIYRNGTQVDGSQRWEYLESAGAKEVLSTSILTALDSLDYLEIFHDASDTMTLFVIRADFNVIKVGSSTVEGAGEVNAGENLGAGQGIYAGKSGSNLQFKSLTSSGIIDLSSSSTEINISATEVDGSVTNELQQVDTFSLTGTTLSLSLTQDGEPALTVDLSSLGGGTDDQNLTVGSGTATTSVIQIEDGTDVTLEAGANVTLSEVGNTITIAATGGGTPGDGDYGDITVSGTGTIWNIDAGVVGPTELESTAVSPGSYTLASITVDADGRITSASNGSEVDGSVTNEGSLTVGAGTATTSLIQSNTSGSTAVTLEAGTNVTLSEVGNTITIAATGDGTGTDDQTLTWNGGTGELSIEDGNTVDLDGRYLESFTEVDGSVTNEGSLTVGAGGANTSTIVSNTSGSTPVTIAGGTNVTVTESGSTITIAASGTGDNLGNHTATTTLDMNDNSILDAQSVDFTDRNVDGNDWLIFENLEDGWFWIASDNNIHPSLALNDDLTVEISNAYTLPTASGTQGQYMRKGAANAVEWAGPVKHVKGASIQAPTNSENVTLFYVDHAITIKQVADVVQGTSPSVTYNIRHATTRNSGTPNNLFSANRTVTSTSGATTTTFNDATIPANSWVWLITSATSGTVNEVNVTLYYEQD